MFKYFCVGFLVLTFSLATYLQDVKSTNKERAEKGTQMVENARSENGADKERVEKGIEIIENARKGIGIDKLISSLSSFQLSVKSVSDLNGSERVNTKEISVLLPDKVLFVSSTTGTFESKLTSIWNGEKYKKLSEFVSPDGQRAVRDITNQESGRDLSKFVKDPKILEQFKKATAIDPKEKLNNDLWNEVFPLILKHPFRTNAEFNYIGKAKSADREANVVDTTTESGRSVRLLIDSKTNQLLSMTEKYKGSDGDYENNYYYSNRELMDKVLIPKKIKVEHKFTGTGRDTKITYEYIDVINFKINPKLKSNLYDVN